MLPRRIPRSERRALLVAALKAQWGSYRRAIQAYEARALVAVNHHREQRRLQASTLDLHISRGGQPTLTLTLTLTVPICMPGHQGGGAPGDELVAGRRPRQQPADQAA